MGSTSLTDNVLRAEGDWFGKQSISVREQCARSMMVVNSNEVRN